MSKKNTTHKNKQELIDFFKASLTDEQTFCSKRWVNIFQYNPISKNTYRSMNQLRLNFISLLRGYEDPRWLTFNQIKKLGYHLKDAKGQGVWIDQYFVKVVDQEYDSDTDQLKPVTKTFKTCSVVFNASLVEGIEKYEVKKLEATKKEDFLMNYLKNENISLFRGGNVAGYNFTEDTIVIPTFTQFKSEDRYFGTLAHEIAHSTGHEQRLNRDQEHQYGSKEYAFEELVAEITSAFICSKLQIERSEEAFDYSKGYVQSWLTLIEDKPDGLITAIKLAEKASDYVFEKGEFSKIFPDYKEQYIEIENEYEEQGLEL